MPTVPKRHTASKGKAAKSSTPSPAPLEFPPGSLEAELVALGNSAPAGTWDNVPTDLWANIDHYLYGAPKRK